MKKLLLFDFDGVVVDTLEMVLGVQKDLGRATTAEEYVKLFHGNIFKNLETAQSRQYTTADQAAFFNLYEPRLLELVPVPGMIETISALSTKFTLAIISSTTNSPIQKYLKRYDLDGCFSSIYGADVDKSKVAKIQLSLAEHATAPEDTVYITDTTGDIKEARVAGVDSIAVTWGFHDQTTLAHSTPRYVVNNPGELNQAISSFFTQ